MNSFIRYPQGLFLKTRCHLFFWKISNGLTENQLVIFFIKPCDAGLSRP